MDQDKLYRHSLLVLAFTHAAGAANLLFHVLMGRTLSKAEYGIMAALLGIALAFYTPMMALHNTLAHATGRLVQSGRSGDIPRLARLWLRRVALLAGPLFLVAFIGRPVFANGLHLPSDTLITATAVILVLIFFLPVFSGILQGVQAFTWMALTSNAWGLLRLGLAAALVLTGTATALTALSCHAAGLLTSLLVGFLGLRALTRTAPPTAAGIESSERYLWMSLLAMAGYSILVYADMALVKAFFPDPEDYGDYARASTIARTMVFLPQPIAAALFPKVISTGARSDGDTRTLLRALGLALVIVMGSVAICLICPRLLLRVLYRESAPTPEVIALVRLVTLAMAPLGPVYLLLTFELAQNRFMCVGLLGLSAAILVAGIVLFHATLWSVGLVVGLASLTAIASLALLALSPRKGLSAGT